MVKISQRSDVSPFLAMDVAKAARLREEAGHSVLHMEFGEPSFLPPKAVVEAAQTAVARERLGYTGALGIEPLRAKIADHYKAWYDLDIDPCRVAVVNGSSAAFQLAFLSAFEAGDRVAIADPGYPPYRNVLKALGIEVVSIPTDASTRFQPTPAQLEAVGDLDGLLVASPANPTGTVLSVDELKALVDYCKANDVRLISDEIYHGLAYEGAAETALRFTDDAIVINSFSKYFCMTGWRLGWMILPEDMVRRIEVLGQNFFISAPTLSQIAAVEAFKCYDEFDANVQKYAANRKVLLEGLPQAGIEKFAPAEGAFYIYADVSHLTGNSLEWAMTLLENTGIAATPGLDFDPSRGGGFMRFSYAGAPEDMVKAIDRLKGWLG